MNPAEALRDVVGALRDHAAANARLSAVLALWLERDAEAEPVEAAATAELPAVVREAPAEAPPVAAEPPASPVEPAPPPVEPPPVPAAPLSVWSDARKALLGTLWRQGLSNAEILPQLNALPGPPIGSGAAVASQASTGLKLGLRGAPTPVSAVWTDARDFILRRDIPADVPFDAIRTALAAAPGAMWKSDASIHARIKELGLRRGQPAPAPPMVAATLVEAMRWGREAGVRMPGALATPVEAMRVLNGHRRQAGLPQFRLIANPEPGR